MIVRKRTAVSSFVAVSQIVEGKVTRSDDVHKSQLFRQKKKKKPKLVFEPGSDSILAELRPTKQPNRLPKKNQSAHYRIMYFIFFFAILFFKKDFFERSPDFNRYHYS